MTRLAGVVRPTLEHLLGAAMVALAAVPWAVVTGDRIAAVQLGAALLGATLLSTAAARSRRVPLAAEVLLSTVGLTALLLLVVVGDPLGGGEVLRGLRDGIPRTLSTSLPLLDVTWAGVPGASVVWAAAAVVASTVTRTRAVARAVLAPLVVFVGGYAVTLGGRTGDVAATALPEGLVLALVVGAFALTRTFHVVPDQERSAVALRLTTAVLTLVLAVGAGTLAASHGPFVAAEPVQPRLEPLVLELEPEGPLLVARRLREEEPDREVAELTVAGSWSGYVPFGVLDRFDGRSWSRADERLTPTGGVLPVTLPAAPGPEVVVRDLDVGATGGWLPYVGRVAAISGTSVLQDDGEVLRLAEPAATTTYRLRSGQPSRTIVDEQLPGDLATARASGLVPSLDVARLVTDQRTAGERVCRLLALTAGETETSAGDLGLLGAPCGRRGPDQLAFVRAIADELAAGRAAEVTDALTGSQAGPESLADLLDLVGPPPSDGPAVGTAEQFAAAYALIADAYGLPVRVVTGFRVDDPPTGETVPLRGEHAWTWAEVALDGEGWVVVDPTPSAEDVAEEEDLASPDAIDQPEAAPQEAPAELGVETERVLVGPPAPEEERGLPLVPILAAAAAALLPVAALLVASGRRAVRRRRRRAGGSRQRVVGAWHHLLDTAAELRVPDLESRTSQQLVETLESRVTRGLPDLRTLPGLVDRAVFSSAAVTDEDADRAWTTVIEARRSLRRTLPRRSRVADAWRVPPREVTGGPRRGGSSRRRGRREGRSGPPAGGPVSGPVVPAATPLLSPPTPGGPGAGDR